MNKSQKDLSHLTLTKINDKLRKTQFKWDTSDLEQEVFRYGKP